MRLPKLGLGTLGDKSRAMGGSIVFWCKAILHFGLGPRCWNSVSQKQNPVFLHQNGVFLLSGHMTCLAWWLPICSNFQVDYHDLL